MRKRNNLEVLSFSLPAELVRGLDALSRKVGYTARSELIRDAIRLLIKRHQKLERLEGMAEGIIIAIYDHSAEKKVSELRHRFTDIVRSYTHCDFDLNDRRCCEVLIFRGEAERVRGLANGMQAIKKVDEIQVFIAR
ncbi:MAG: CopG family ribbon-helix-helix protein [Thermoplasmata archaeon]